MRKQHISKVFIILLFSTAYMLGFSHYGSLAINNIMDTGHDFEANTTVGSVDVSNKTIAEANDLITKETEKWKKDSLIEFTYKETSAVFNTDAFLFNNEKTIQEARSGQRNVMSVTLKKNAIEEFISSLSSELAVENIDQDKLSSDLLAIASTLDSGPLVYHLEKYMDGSAEQMETISKASISVEDREREIRLLIKAVPEIEIPAKAQVSLVETIKAANITKKDKVSSGIFASAVYEAIMPTNFNILERNISRELPDYTNEGYEARIDLDKQVDLIFSNPNDTVYTLHFSIEGSKLVVNLKGQSFLYKYNLVKEDETKFKPKTIKQYSALLNENESKVSVEGKDGLLIRIVRKTIDEKGEEILSEVLSDDFYGPIHRVIVTGLKEPKVEPPAEETENEEESENGEESESVPEESEEEQSGNEDNPENPTEDGKPVEEQIEDEESTKDEDAKPIEEDAEEESDASENTSK